MNRYATAGSRWSARELAQTLTAALQATTNLTNTCWVQKTLLARQLQLERRSSLIIGLTPITMYALRSWRHLHPNGPRTRAKASKMLELTQGRLGFNQNYVHNVNKFVLDGLTVCHSV